MYVCICLIDTCKCVCIHTTTQFRPTRRQNTINRTHRQKCQFATEICCRCRFYAHKRTLSSAYIMHAQRRQIIPLLPSPPSIQPGEPEDLTHACRPGRATRRVSERMFLRAGARTHTHTGVIVVICVCHTICAARAARQSTFDRHDFIRWYVAIHTSQRHEAACVRCT